MDELVQRLVLAGALGFAMARKAAAILEDAVVVKDDAVILDEAAQAHEGAVLRAILDGANECLGQFDERPPGERWCDALLRLLDLATFAREFETGAVSSG
jgi:hypothetical protein